METETHYQYDEIDRLVGVTYADGRKVEYTYDPAGNRVSVKVSGAVQPTPEDKTPETPTLKPVTTTRIIGYQLVPLVGAVAGTAIEMLPEMGIGRQKENEIRIEDELVSRRHAIVRVEGENCLLTDLGSSNGTFVNGERVEGSVTSQAGDVIRIGGSEFTLAAVMAALSFDEARTVLAPRRKPWRRSPRHPHHPCTPQSLSRQPRQFSHRRQKPQSGCAPDCNQPVEAKARFCGSCGQPLELIAETPPGPQSCPFCGAPTIPGKRFCRQCGHPLG